MIHLPFHRHTKTKYIELNTHLCQACWACVDVCPNGVLGKIDFHIHKHAHIDDAQSCKGCRKCVKACQNQAITALKLGHGQGSQQKTTFLSQIELREAK